MHKKTDFTILPTMLFSLIFSINKTNQGIIIALGLLVLYPFLTVCCSLFKKFLKIERGYYLILFISVLLMSTYLRFISSLDSKVVEGILFNVPASMAAGSFLLLGFSPPKNSRLIKQEIPMFFETFLSAFLIIAFSCLRDILLTSSINLTFAGSGQVIPLSLPTIEINIKAVSLLIMALILGLLSFFEENTHV